MNRIDFKLNSRPVHIETDPSRRLLDVLRDDFHLLGLKEGCGEGECGACAVLLDNRIINSCITPIGNIAGREIVTIEGYALTERYKVIKEAFEEAGAVQCGACTPGMIIASESLLDENPNPTEAQIREGLSGNLCRCTGYNMIVKAIQIAIERGEHLWQ